MQKIVVTDCLEKCVIRAQAHFQIKIEIESSTSEGRVTSAK